MTIHLHQKSLNISPTTPPMMNKTPNHNISPVNALYYYEVMTLQNLKPNPLIPFEQAIGNSKVTELPFNMNRL